MLFNIKHYEKIIAKCQQLSLISLKRKMNIYNLNEYQDIK